MTFLPLNSEPDDEPNGHVVVLVHEGAAVRVDDGERPDGGHFLGLLDGHFVWGVDALELDDPDERDPALYRDLRMQWGALDEVRWMVAGRGIQVVEWARTHRFCGRCATPNEPTTTPGERALRCPSCGLLAFPRLAPAVITLIEREDGRVLLARNVHFPGAMYSLLAGFVEPGETLEECVARETKEEVGVDVDQITYWGSQPWPFPHSLMIGFRARYAGGDIVLQEDEIADAAWFARDDLPVVPPPMSIAGRILGAWREEGDR